MARSIFPRQFTPGLACEETSSRACTPGEGLQWSLRWLSGLPDTDARNRAQRRRKKKDKLRKEQV